MQNKFAAEVSTKIQGKPFTICIDWNALARVESECGRDAFVRMYEGLNPHLVAKVGAAALAKHHPEMTEEAIIEASPPFMVFRADIDRALAAALYGNEEVKPKEAKAPKFLRWFRKKSQNQ